MPTADFISIALSVSLLAQNTEADARRLHAMGQLLFWLFMLFLVFLVGSLVIFRMSRGFRATLEHRRAEPTPTDDVWAMHELPDGAVEAVPEDPTQDPAEDDDERATRERGVALITGAARRVGRATSLALAAAGYDVVLHFDHSQAAARSTASDIEAGGGRAHLVQGDLSDTAVPRQLIEATLRSGGRLDVLVNNAATFAAMPLDQFDISEWQRVMQVNLAAPIELARAALPALRDHGGGSIVNLCDISTDGAWPNYLAYGPSKAGLDYATRALARALAPEVRVNGVAPGIVAPVKGCTPEEQERLIERVPLRRAGTPEDVARAVRFLVESPYITGQIIRVDGGRSMA